MISDRTERLHALMMQHALKCPDVAKMLDREAQTVRGWRCEAQIIPDHTLKALETEIAQRYGGTK